MGFPDSSVGKESTCNAGDPGSIPQLGRSAGEGIGYPLLYSWAFLVAYAGKESTCNAGDPGSIPGLGRSSGEGNSYPLQYCGLENSMDCPWDPKELDMIEWLSLSLLTIIGCLHFSMNFRISYKKKRAYCDFHGIALNL